MEIIDNFIGNRNSSGSKFRALDFPKVPTMSLDIK